jgi:hypothetical protein
MGRAGKSDAPSRKKAHWFFIEWNPQWLTAEGQESRGNQSPVAVIYPRVERG